METGKTTAFPRALMVDALAACMCVDNITQISLCVVPKLCTLFPQAFSRVLGIEFLPEFGNLFADSKVELD